MAGQPGHIGQGLGSRPEERSAGRMTERRVGEQGSRLRQGLRGRQQVEVVAGWAAPLKRERLQALPRRG